MTKKILILLMCALQVHPCMAQLFDMSKQLTNSGSEYFVGKEYGKPLIKINLISGVQKPGVYHVPTGTDLAEMIAYAGGASEKADLGDITILRSNAGKKNSLEVDLERHLSRTGQMPLVADQDIVHIPLDRSVDRAMNWVGIFSGIASIALAITLIDANQNN